MTPQRTLSASATPAPATDAINKQAQHILALNETESVLKGFLARFWLTIVVDLSSGGDNNFLRGEDAEMFDESQGIGSIVLVTGNLNLIFKESRFSEEISWNM